MNAKEPIFNLITIVLFIEVFNNILRLFDLRANDSMDKSKLENTDNCIVNIAENSPIDRINVRECYLKDNFSNLSPRKVPSFLDSDVFYRFGLSIEWTGFRLTARDKASPSSSSTIRASLVLFGTTMLANICITPTLFIQEVSVQKIGHAMTGGYFRDL